MGDVPPTRPAQGWGGFARTFARIGATGFGGPPAHLQLLRGAAVHGTAAWLSEEEFADAVAAASLLPGPASTQVAFYCAWRAAGPLGALVGGLLFVLPGLVAALVAAAVLLHHPPRLVLGLAAGASAAVPAVALHAAAGLLLPSWRGAGGGARRVRWVAYVVAGAGGVWLGSGLVLVLLGCGAVEAVVRTRPARGRTAAPALGGPVLLARRGWAVAIRPAAAVATGGLAAVAWVALKVGALSFGGGFVIVPLIQHDAVTTYHWLTPAGFLNAVAIGQVTPGPVVLTVAVVGYAARGLVGGLLAAAVVFAPSLAFVLLGGSAVPRLRERAGLSAFVAGSSPAALGAIGGSAVPLAAALSTPWQAVVAVAAAAYLLVRRPRTALAALAAAAACGVVAVAIGLAMPS